MLAQMALTSAASYESVIELMAALESNFSGSVRPQLDQSKLTDVDIHVSLLKIAEVVSISWVQK